MKKPSGLRAFVNSCVNCFIAGLQTKFLSVEVDLFIDIATRIYMVQIEYSMFWPS